MKSLVIKFLFLIFLFQSYSCSAEPGKTKKPVIKRDEGSVVMVIAEKFRDEELFVTRNILENSGFKTIIASTSTGPHTGMLGGTAEADLSLKKIDSNKYDAIILVGGIGSRSLYDNTVLHSIINKFNSHNKIIGAICLAPGILLRAGVLYGKRVTMFPVNEEIDLMEKYGVFYVEQNVVQDDNIITGNGPAAAEKFGTIIAKKLNIYKRTEFFKLNDTDNYKNQRIAMVNSQIAARDITNDKVLDVMRRIPRHLFIPETNRKLSYIDAPIPIGENQTISQPYIVAFMTEALNLKGNEKVLEIGTGSGYQAAILGEIVPEVYTIEIIESLSKRAKKLLRKMYYSNIKVKTGDGYKGWKEHAPFDAIIVTAAPDHIPQPLIDQLKTGGKMIIPVGDLFQKLILITKTETGITKKNLLPVRFVPMTGEAQTK